MGIVKIEKELFGLKKTKTRLSIGDKTIVQRSRFWGKTEMEVLDEKTAVLREGISGFISNFKSLGLNCQESPDSCSVVSKEAINKIKVQRKKRDIFIGKKTIFRYIPEPQII